MKCLKQSSYIAIRRSFFYFRHCIFLMLMNSWQFHLSNWHGVVCPTWAISISFVYTGLLASSFPQSHKFNLTDCLKSSLLLQFYFLFVYMVDQTEMYPSRISPLKLFHRIKCNIGRLKGETLRGGGGGGWLGQEMALDFSFYSNCSFSGGLAHLLNFFEYA